MTASASFCYAARSASSPWPAIVREPGIDRVAPGTVPAPTVPAPTVPASTVLAPSVPAPADAALAPSGAAPTDAGSAEDSDDELFLLGERIADLAARINAAESRMMTLIADFDRRGGWKDAFSSCAEWLAWRIGIKIGPARERVRTARALENLPETADALSEGRISYTKVRALTRVATPESEGELLEFARAGSAAKLERMVRMWKKLSREGELTVDEARHRGRCFSVFVDGDGMYVVKGRLEPEAGAVLMRAVEAASDALFNREREVENGGEGARNAMRSADDASPEPKQRRADAVGLLAERALAAGFGGGARGEPGRAQGEQGGELDAIARGARGTEPVETPSGDPADAPGGEPRVESGTRAERYQVVVHADAATLAEEGEPGRSDLDGIRVSAETSRRMACDAAVVAMLHGEDGSVLNVGRRTRTISPHIRRALEERDRGCRFPGCAGRFTEAHHVKHWADGGETSLGNTLLLCRRHHRTVHEGRVKVCVNRDGTVLFFTRTGRILADAPKRPGRADAPGQVADAPKGPGRADAQKGRVAARSIARNGRPVGASAAGLPPLPPGTGTTLSNGAALYQDSAIPWAIEAAAREAMEGSLEADL